MFLNYTTYVIQIRLFIGSFMGYVNKKYYTCKVNTEFTGLYFWISLFPKAVKFQLSVLQDPISVNKKERKKDNPEKNYANANSCKHFFIQIHLPCNFYLFLEILLKSHEETRKLLLNLRECSFQISCLYLNISIFSFYIVTSFKKLQTCFFSSATFL